MSSAIPLLEVSSSGPVSMEKFTNAMVTTLVESGSSATVTTSEFFRHTHRINFQTLPAHLAPRGDNLPCKGDSQYTGKTQSPVNPTFSLYVGKIADHAFCRF